MSNQSKLQQMKAQLKELSKEQQAQIKGGAFYCYGDGICRDGIGGQPSNSRWCPPYPYSGYC